MFFQSLAPILAHAKLNLMITSVKDEKISVVLVPTPNMPDSLLSKPMSFLGTAAELDSQLLDQLFEISNDYADLSTLISQQKSSLKEAKNEAAKASVAKSTKAATPATKATVSTPEQIGKSSASATDEQASTNDSNDDESADDESQSSPEHDTHTLSLF